MRADAAFILIGMGYSSESDFEAHAKDDGTTRITWLSQSPQPTEAEIDAAAPAAQAALDAAQADAAAYESQRTEVASNLTAMRDRLVLIRDAASPTNAQVIQAVRDLAAIELRILNYIRRL